MCWPTLDELKAWMGITSTTDDAWLEHKMAVAISNIENYTQRWFVKATYTEKIRAGCGGESRMYLHAVPVESINNVSGVSSFHYDNNGVFCFTCVTNADVSVEYIGGYDPIPVDILDVFYNMMGSLHANKNKIASSGRVKSESIPGVLSTHYFDDAAAGALVSSDPGLPGYYSSILDGYVLQKA